MRTIRPRIEDIFPNVLTTGAVLRAISAKYPTFATDLGLDNSNIMSFDIWYISKSGLRPISKLLKMLTDKNRLTLVTDSGQRLVVDNADNLVGVKGLINLDSDTLADVIYNMFINDWKRLSRTFSIEYDPTQPYSMKVKEGGTLNRSSSNDNKSNNIENGTETINRSSTNENKLEGSENMAGRSNSNGSNKKTAYSADDTNGVITRTGSNNSDTKINERGETINNKTAEDKVSAFDSAEYQPNNLSTEYTANTYNNSSTTSVSGSNSGTDTNVNSVVHNSTEDGSTTGSETSNRDTTVNNTEKGTTTGNETGTNYSTRNSTWGGTSSGEVTTTRDITREGNIGNKSAQELLQEERELRLEVFWDYIRKDLDRVLTLPIYI